MECWRSEEEDSGDPPRLWAPNAMFPGTAFTRSIGDAREDASSSLPILQGTYIVTELSDQAPGMMQHARQSVGQ